MRRRALDRGYDEFRLVVVSPPHPTDVHIEGLEEQLREHLRETPPERLKNLPNRPSIENVSDLDIDSISIAAGGTRVTGTAVVGVSEPRAFGSYHGAVQFDSSPWAMNFPFNFDITLDNELELTGECKIDVDISSWAD